MKRIIDYKITSKITDDLPDIKIDISYSDEFTDDHYEIRSMADMESATKLLPFEIFKNNQPMGKIEMTERDVTGFFETLFAEMDDADFKEKFYSDIFKPLSADISKFFNAYERLVIDNEITTEGEIKRMGVLSGIIS